MDYEKKYKQLHTLINDLYPYMSEHCKEKVEGFFPELAESEDERTRKEIIDFLKLPHAQFVGKRDYKKWIAWLEKQDTPKDYNSIDPHFGKPIETESKFKVGDWVVWDNKISCHIDNIYQGKESLMYEITDAHNMTRSYGVKGFDNNAHLWTIEDVKEGDVLARNNDILSICIFSRFDGINNRYSSFLCHCGLEGEGLGQILSINGYHDDCKDYVPATKEQCNLLFQKIKEAGYEWDADKKNLKPDLKNSPKFKVGDWVTDGYFNAKITDVLEDRYLIDTKYEKKSVILFNTESRWHLWTIQDAKDGDVLTCRVDDGKILIFIYECLGNSFDGEVNVHAGLDGDGYFSASTAGVCCKFMFLLTPSTKEQREFFFAKMKEAGYEWDADRKELRGIKHL